MNRLLLLLLMIGCTLSPVFSDELDTIISWSLSNSLKGQSLDNMKKQALLERQAQYLTLLPGMRLTADFDAGTYGGADYSISFSESFSHVDSVIQSLRLAEMNQKKALINVELAKREHIDSLISFYIDLSLQKKKLEITRADIANQRVLYNIMKVRQQNGREILLNVEKQANEITLSEADLSIDEIGFQNLMRSFIDMSGGAPAEFNMRAEFKEEAPLSQHELSLQKGWIDVTNNQISSGLKKREQWLPRLDLSFSWSMDIDNNSSSYNLGAGLSFSVLDYWERKNSIDQLNIRSQDLQLSISNAYVQWQNDRILMSKKIESLEKKITALEKEVELDKKLQDLYKYQYDTDQIDYHEYRRRQNVLLTSELNLLRLQGDYIRLRKRLQYGILKP